METGSYKNFPRFLESCAQLERGLWWLQLHRHPDLAALESPLETYPRKTPRIPLRTSTLERCLCPVAPPEHLEFRTSDLVIRGARKGKQLAQDQTVSHAQQHTKTRHLPSFLAPAAAAPLTQPGCGGRTFSSSFPIFCPVK